MKKICLLLFILFLASTSFSLAAPPSPWHRCRNGSAGLCLDIDKNGVDDVRINVSGSNLILYDDNHPSGLSLSSLLAGSSTEDMIEFIIDGGGTEITTGEKGFIIVPWDCTITSVTLLADQSGSIVIDLWYDTFANFPPDNSDSITAAAPATISTAQKSQDSTLTGWSKSLTRLGIISYNVDSVTDIERVTIVLDVDK